MADGNLGTMCRRELGFKSTHPMGCDDGVETYQSRVLKHPRHEPVARQGLFLIWQKLFSGFSNCVQILVACTSDTLEKETAIGPPSGNVILLA